MRERDWVEDAECRKLDPVEAERIFFPPQGSSSQQARSICRGCPVREPCLEEALSYTRTVGIWAGTDEKERRQIRRQRREARVA